MKNSENQPLREKLPDEAAMRAWREESSPKFCLRNLITEGVLTPRMLDWVCDHWPHALTMSWKKESARAPAPPSPAR